MLYSREWLSQYVELPASATEVGELTTSIGFAVEGIERVGDDEVLDLEINPNRPDCMNHLGLAREIAAASGTGTYGTAAGMLSSVVPNTPARLNSGA